MAAPSRLTENLGQDPSRSRRPSDYQNAETDKVTISDKRKLKGRVIMVGGENSSKSCHGLFKLRPASAQPSLEKDGVSVVAINPARSRSWVRGLSVNLRKEIVANNHLVHFFLEYRGRSGGQNRTQSFDSATCLEKRRRKRSRFGVHSRNIRKQGTKKRCHHVSKRNIREQ